MQVVNGVVELEGPQAYSPDDAASAFAAALGRPVKAIAVPEADWAPTLAKGGFTPRTIDAWSEMFRGFNDGTIAFETKSAPAAARSHFHRGCRPRHRRKGMKGTA